MYDLAELEGILPSPEPKPTQPATIARSGNGNNGRYAEAALQDELQKLLAATEGGRNTQLNQSAFALGQLVGAGALEYTTTETALEDAALSIGLSESETRASTRSGLTAGMAQPRGIPERPTMSIGSFPLTDLGNAERLAYRHGDELRFVPQWGYMAYTGRQWERNEGEARRLAKDTVRAIYLEAASAANEDTRKATAKHAMRAESEQRINAMLSLAESESAIEARPEWFDNYPILLNVQNGTIDLKAGELYPHRASDLITRMAGTHYDPNATCPLWLSFLYRIFDGNRGLISFVQRAAGYSLTGGTGEQCLFFCYGTGANGKSTYLEALRALLGDYAQQADFTTFLTHRGDAIRNDIARLAGARFVSAVEAGEGRRLAEVLIKQLTGGDTITARFLHREFFEYTPQFKIWLAANHKPIIRGTDHAIWRRIRLVPFTVTIPEDEQDKALAAKLLDELPGILTWAIEGCLQWQRDGLQTPSEVITATEGYRVEMDTIAAWLDECCAVAPDAEAMAADLLESWREWSGEKRTTSRGLAAQLRERGFEPGRSTSGKRAWRGVGLQTRSINL